MERYLSATELLDFNHPSIQKLVSGRGWRGIPEFDQISGVYDFVQNEIDFGYNEADDIPASQVLKDGHGQCNTKGILLMALLRLCGIPCRFHGFTIDKVLQKGAITGIAYRLAPKSIIHSWVEVRHTGRWVNLEGFILDRVYLTSVQTRFSDVEEAFCGYAIATPDLANPPVQWDGNDTYIQCDGINKDYGVFDSPDDFYNQVGVNLSPIKKLLFTSIVRKIMNRNILRIRSGIW